MFGYVTPCIMELKVKDYEKFKAYYCGLCKSIKNNIGNIPRFALNYDMTFFAILMDSLSDEKPIYKKESCILHPFKKRLVLEDNKSLEYAAFLNTELMSYKLLDNINDDKSLKSKFYYIFLKNYLKNFPSSVKVKFSCIEDKLSELYNLETSSTVNSIDEISQPFSELTALLFSNFGSIQSKNELHALGYNLGKWIYIIDSWDDLEDDMKKHKFNAICAAYNKNNLPFEKLHSILSKRIDFILTSCGRQCFKSLNKLPVKKNGELLNNILQFGIIEKMDKIFKRSCCKDEQSL